MIIFYILNVLLLIVAIIAIFMQFSVIKKQKEITDMNNFVLGMNKLFVEKKMIIREPDCSLRGVSVNTAICNMQPILVLDLFDDKKKENDTKN